MEEELSKEEVEKFWMGKNSERNFMSENVVAFGCAVGILSIVGYLITLFFSLLKI